MEIRTFGGGERIKGCARRLSEIGCGGVERLMLLPIPTTRDGKVVTGTELELSALAETVGRGDAVAGYGIPEEVKVQILFRGGGVYDGSLDEEFLCENAELTARGAMGHLLTEYGKDVSDMKIGLIGMGRIGSRLLRYLLFFSAKVTLFTTKRELAGELCAAGVNAPEGLDGAFDLELLINTAPKRLFRENEMSRLLSGGRVLDLASGDAFPVCDRVCKLSSVPERFYPESAGAIYAKYISKFFGGEGDV